MVPLLVRACQLFDCLGVFISCDSALPVRLVSEDCHVRCLGHVSCALWATDMLVGV